MTTREKRYALIYNQKDILAITMRELSEAIEIYTKVANNYAIARTYDDIASREFRAGGKWYTLESAFALLESAQNAVTNAEKTLNNYKYTSDENIESEYALLEIAGIHLV